MALQAAEMQRKKQVFMIAGRKTDNCLPENVYTENHISSALPLLCNRGRRFIAGASYGGLEMKKALMNVGVVGLQEVNILVILYALKSCLLSGVSTPTKP